MRAESPTAAPATPPTKAYRDHALTGDSAGVRGLAPEQAAARLAADGPNEISTVPPPHVSRRVGQQLADPLILLLLVSAAVTALLRDPTDTAVILLVVAVNTAIGVAQEVRADRAVAALHRMAAPTARVVRGGTHTVVPAAEVVRGDVVVLAAGDVVPADARLLDAYRLRLDEAALTGESVPVDRGPGEDVNAGTVVVTGRGVGRVVRTGPASALGRIAEFVASARPGPTPLQRRLARLGRQLGIVAVALSALVTLIGVVAGRPVVQMAITGVSLVVAAVPESLPAVVTLALALGAQRMAKAHAIARRLHAVETLGSVTVLASDKTGTLTEGRMAVQRVVTADGTSYDVRGTGYEPDGSIHDEAGQPCTGTLPAPVLELARAALLCNDASLDEPTESSPQWTPVGDPLEAALVAFATRCGLDPHAERARAPRVREEPFDARTRRMVTVHRLDGGRTLTVAKGAPETVLGSHALAEAAHELARQGLRVLAVAAGSDRALDADARMRPLGLLGVGDPVRGKAGATIGAFEQAGVRIILVTGDHPATATAVASGLGIWHEGDVVADGTHPRDADLSRVRVFARTPPEHKLDIVAALQAQGHVVAMTGDGVNDAPALRQADIGVAMGESGTEVARQAADLVLTDDDLGTLAVAVAEGRRIYDNIRRFLRYALAGGVAELALMLLGPLCGLPLPLLPAQILWINLLTHGLPGVALGAEPGSPAAASRPPRSPQESVLGGGLARAMLTIGALIAACALGAGVVTSRYGAPWQSITFLVLGLAQLGVALAVRAPRHRGRPGNPWLYAAVGLSAVLMVAAVGTPILRDLLGTAPLTLVQLLGSAAVAAVPGLAVATHRRHRRRHPAPSQLH